MLRSGSVIPHLGVDPIHVLHGSVRNVMVATTTTKECRGGGNDDKRSGRGRAPVAAAGPRWRGRAAGGRGRGNAEAGVQNESSALDNQPAMENTVLRQEHRSPIKESS